MLSIILSYFDKIMGPSCFISIPQEIDERIIRVVEKLMDLELNANFFKYYTREFSDITFYNYLFEISSEKGRGNQELLMITVIANSQLNSDPIENHIREMAKKIREYPNIFKLFYPRSQPLEEKQQQNDFIYFHLKNFYLLMQKQVEELEILDNFFQEHPIIQNITTTNINLALLTTFITTIDMRTPQGSVLLSNIGYRAGCYFKNFFQSNSIKDLIDELSKFWQQQAFGEIQTLTNNKEGYIFTVHNSFEAKPYKELGYVSCKFQEGFFNGLLQTKLGESYIVKELECLSSGNSFCKFVIWNIPRDPL